MKKTGLVFYKFGDVWVLPTKGRTPDGSMNHIEPVLLVQKDDAQGLSRAILEQIYHEVPVKEPDPKSESFRKTVMAKALNLKSYRAFYDGARAFDLVKSPDELSVQEWKKLPRLVFGTPGLWKRTFGPEDIDELVWFLIKHEDVAFPDLNEPEEHKSSRSRKRTRAPH